MLVGDPPSPPLVHWPQWRGPSLDGTSRGAKCTRGSCSNSLLLAGGKLYTTNERGTTSVMATGKKFKIFATNQVDDDWVISSFAVCKDRSYLRGPRHLYCIGNKSCHRGTKCHHTSRFAVRNGTGFLNGHASRKIRARRGER